MRRAVLMHVGICFGLVLVLGSGVIGPLPASATHQAGHACTITGTDGHDILPGTEGDDVICGLGGNDFIEALGGNDFIYGGPGNDSIVDGAGNDVVEGQGAGDFFQAGPGDDSYDGDGETSPDECFAFDHVTYEDAPNSITGTVGGTVTGWGTDTLATDVEGLHGSGFADQLNGNSVVSNVNLFGGGGNDTIQGSDSFDALSGGAGNDNLNGGGGDDIVVYYDAVVGVTIDLRQSTANDGTPSDPSDPSSTQGTDTLISIESVGGSPFGDQLTGTDDQNSLLGEEGVDTLTALGGTFDYISDGAGDDVSHGGEGDDHFGQNFNFAHNGPGSDADVMNGGNHINGDHVDYSERPGPVTVTFDDVANDGETNENDNVRPDIEFADLPQASPPPGSTDPPAPCGGNPDPDPEPEPRFFPPENTDPPANPATISGTVTYRDDNGAIVPLANAEVFGCSMSQDEPCSFARTDASGAYTLTQLPPGEIRLHVVPPYEPPAGVPTDLLSQSLQRVVDPNGNHTGVDVQLARPQRIPADTAIENLRTYEGIPTVSYSQPLTLTKHGCAGGSATYDIKIGDKTIASGAMTESPPGTYTAETPSLNNPGSRAEVRIMLDCPGETPDDPSVFDIYIDPSGWVRTVSGEPIVGATVTLFRSDSAAGPFVEVPNGSAIMSPANRRNPDVTDSEGHFGWDVIAGFYLVRAQAEGCVDPNNPASPFVESRVMLIPPPVFDLDLRLRCSAAGGGTPGGGGGGGGGETQPSPGATAPADGGGDNPPPTEPTEHGRLVRFWLQGHLVAEGRVKALDNFSACMSNVQVRIQRKNRAGEWKNVTTVSTDEEGRYRVRLDDREGLYRSRAIRITPSGTTTDVCLAQRSAWTRRHTHRGR